MYIIDVSCYDENSGECKLSHKAYAGLRFESRELAMKTLCKLYFLFDHEQIVLFNEDEGKLIVVPIYGKDIYFKIAQD